MAAGCSQENIDLDRASVAEELKTSFNRRLQQVGVRENTIWCILRMI